jgi:hypothetical protein
MAWFGHEKSNSSEIYAYLESKEFTWIAELPLQKVRQAVPV